VNLCIFLPALESLVSSFLVKKGDKTRGHTQQPNKEFVRGSFITPVCFPQIQAGWISAGELAGAAERP